MRHIPLENQARIRGRGTFLWRIEPECESGVHFIRESSQNTKVGYILQLRSREARAQQGGARTAGKRARSWDARMREWGTFHGKIKPECNSTCHWRIEPKCESGAHPIGESSQNAGVGEKTNQGYPLVPRLLAPPPPPPWNPLS
jgi:hypothetical protein